MKNLANSCGGDPNQTDEENYAEWREYHRHGPRYFPSVSGGRLGDPNPNHPLNRDSSSSDDEKTFKGRKPKIPELNQSKAPNWDSTNGEFANGEGSDSRFSNQKIPDRHQSLIPTIFTGLKF